MTDLTAKELATLDDVGCPRCAHLHMHYNDEPCVSCGCDVMVVIYDDAKVATDAAMNYGQGYQDAMLEVAEANFIGSAKLLNKLRSMRGLEDLSAKDLPSLESGGSSGGGRSDDEGQSDGGKSDNPVQHVGSPSGVGVLEPTPPLKYLTIKLADGSEAVSLEDADRVRAEYQRFYDFVADNDTSLVDAWHFGENNKPGGLSEQVRNALLEDQPALPGGTTAIIDGGYVDARKLPSDHPWHKETL